MTSNVKHVQKIVGVFKSVVLANHNNNMQIVPISVSALLSSPLHIMKMKKLTLDETVHCCVLRGQGLSMKEIS